MAASRTTGIDSPRFRNAGKNAEPQSHRVYFVNTDFIAISGICSHPYRQLGTVAAGRQGSRRIRIRKVPEGRGTDAYSKIFTIFAERHLEVKGFGSKRSRKKWACQRKPRLELTATIVDESLGIDEAEG
jgi:hypothetical protein